MATAWLEIAAQISCAVCSLYRQLLTLEFQLGYGSLQDFSLYADDV
jgi:hypothetical protein